MVSEALDGLTDEQLADLELQESGLVSGQNEGAIAFTPFAQRMNPQPAVEPQAQPEPAALSDYELNKLEEENYRRVDYVMTPQEFDQYWDRREKEDQEVGRFIDGLGQGAAGLVGMVPEAGRELRDGMVGMVTDPVNQVQRNVQTGAEIVRKAGINLVQLYDWVGSKVDDLTTSSKRAEAINAGIRAQLQAEGRFTGDRTQDEQIYQAALIEARKAGAYKPTAEQVLEDRQKAYDRYVREKSIERDYAGVSQFKTGESAMSSPTSAQTYQITDEKPMQTVSQLGAMAIDPVNLIPTGAGALSKARILRRMAVLSEKPLLGVERAAGGLADVAERVETGLSTRIQDITGLTQKQQAALGAGVAGTAVYVDSATESQGGLTKAVMMVGGVLPALHYGGGLLRKVGSAAGGASTIVREAGVGGLGVARAEAAAGLANNAAIPERYRKFFTGYVEGTDSTLKRVAQNADNPEALRRVSRFADRVGATQVARVADDAVSGAVTAGIVGTPFAALQPDAERAGEVMGGILALGAAGGVAGGFARRRSSEVADADIARMFADVQASGGNVEAFSRLPHQTLDRLSAMQGVLAGKVDFIPLSGDEYRMNADIAQNAGETTAGVFVDKDANNRARVFINLDAKTKAESIAPHEIGHAILTSDILDGQPRADLRNLVNQQYGPEGVVARGREYIGRLIDGDARAKTTGEMPTVLTEAEMAAVDGGKTMDDVVADRMKDTAERERLINERFEEFSQRSIDKGQDPLDWARDEIIAETFASEAPAIDFRAIRRDGTFPRIAESMLSAGGRVLEMFGANFSSTGRLLDNPSVLFRDNPLFQDRIMQKRVREYVRSYDQFLAGLEEAGSAAPKGVELARSNNPADLGRSTHVKLRDEGRGVLENDFLFQKPDGTYSFKPQKLINQAETSRAAQIKTLYDARKFVPVNSTEFGKRKVNGRETIGGPVLPPQFDLFTHFPKHVREFARAMEQSRAEGGSWDIDYNAIGTGSSGRYRITNMGAVRAIQRETVPFGWQVTKQNHLLAASLDLNAFRASAMKAINKGELGVFNNDMRQVEADLKTYLGNHRNGLPGEAGIGQAKRDMLNGLIGTGTAVQRTANPLYYELNPKGSIRTWRVDRLNDAKPTGRTGYFFDYDKINNNRMPQALPREAMGMPDVPVRGERADIPLNPRARRAAFISDRGEVRSTGRATHFETNEDLGPDFLAIGAGHLGEDGFFRFGSQTMDDAMGESPATSAAAAARFNQSLYDQGRRPSAMLEEPPGLERTSDGGQTGQAMPDITITPDEARRRGLVGPVYHGSPDFKGRKFDPKYRARSSGISRGGFSFSDDVASADGYAAAPIDSAQAAVDSANDVMREAAGRMERGLKIKGFSAPDELPEFNVRYVDDIGELSSYFNELAKDMPKDLATRLRNAAKQVNQPANPVVVEAYLRNPKTMDIDGKKLWLVDNPDDIFVSAARPPQGAATGGTRGQAMPDVAPTLQNFDAAQQATGGTLRPIADQPENAPVSGRLTPEQSASIEELQEYYRSVTPQRVKELQADAVESLASRLINKGIPVTEANDMAKATFRTLRSRVNGAMQVISGMGTSDLSRMAGTGRPAVATRKGVNPNWLTSAFEAFDTDNDLALMKAQQVARQLNKEQQAQVAAGQSVDAARASGVRSATIDQGMQFVIGEKTADQKAFGSSLREDPSAPPRVYASVVEGQKFGSQGNYNVFFEWKKDAPMVVTSHHHYGVGNGLTDIHASANIGDKNARSFGDPQAEVYDTLPSGKKVLRTRLLVGNAGAADIRAHQLMVSIPESALSGIKKKGAAGARAELNRIAISQLVGSASQGKTQSFTSKDGVAPMVAIQRNRTEAYVLNPDLKNVASITIVSNSPKETALIKKNLANAFKNNGSPLPRIKVVSAESGPSGNPGRKKITDEFFNLTGKVVYGAALGGAAALAADQSEQ